MVGPPFGQLNSGHEMLTKRLLQPRLPRLLATGWCRHCIGRHLQDFGSVLVEPCFEDPARGVLCAIDILFAENHAGPDTQLDLNGRHECWTDSK
jgi:hypothetical protein